MNPYQHLSFASVEEMLAYLPAEECKVVEVLREIVLSCLPQAKEKLAYNVPFYYQHSRLCFIWPGSVPWGSIKEGVLIGFCKGHLLSDASYLDMGNRKNVFTKKFNATREINREKLEQLLYETAWIDEEEKKRKRNEKVKKH